MFGSDITRYSDSQISVLWNGIDLAGCDVRMVVRQRNVVFVIEEVTIDHDYDNTAIVTGELTQAQTARLKVGEAKVQLIIITPDEKRIQSNEEVLRVRETLYNYTLTHSGSPDEEGEKDARSATDEEIEDLIEDLDDLRLDGDVTQEGSQGSSQEPSGETVSGSEDDARTATDEEIEEAIGSLDTL